MAQQDNYVQEMNSDIGEVYPIEDFVNKSKGNATVATPCSAYKEMEKHWELPGDLIKGTIYLQEDGREWLPQEPAENNRAYLLRLKRTVLLETYKRTLDTLAGLPFMRPATTSNFPIELEYLSEDIDNEGTDLSSYAHDLLWTTLHKGLVHFLVDMPSFDSSTTSAKDAEDLKIRPYFVKVDPEALIGWRVKRVGGTDIVENIRIKETVYAPDGWDDVEIEQIKVIYADRWEIHRQRTQDKQWVVYDEGINPLGYIPLVTVYGNKMGRFEAIPVLEGLAWLNLQHWQRSSDYLNILHKTAVPFLLGTGIPDNQLDNLEVGPDRIVTTSSEMASLTYVELTGQSIPEHRAFLDGLKADMALMGADVIMRKGVDRQTATARKIDQSESIALLQIIVNDIEAALKLGVKYAADWYGMDVNKVDPVIDNGDYLDTSEPGPNMIDLLVSMLIEKGGMDVKDAAYELQRMGIFSDTFKVKEPEETEVSETPTEDSPKEDTSEEDDSLEDNQSETDETQ